MLASTTKSQYRSNLRRLWEIYNIMPEADERRDALFAQIQRLCDKLGYEVDRLNVVLFASRRGRPIVNPDVSDIAAELKARKEDPEYWTPAAVEARAKAKMQESEERLRHMMEVANEGSKATDDVGGTGKDNPVVQK